MKLVKLNSRSPGTRHQLNLTKNLLSKNSNILKNVIFKISNKTKGGGCKKKFRKIKFNNFNSKSIVIMINYDPYRNSFITLNFDFYSKFFFFSTAIQSTFPGSIYICQKKKLELYFGNRSTLINFPIGALISNISKTPLAYELAKYCRAAGTYCQIIQKQKQKIQIRLPSGKFVLTSSSLFATFGRVSNIKKNLVILGKAGRNRLKGIRPHVRGVAMNPVDHPHGGRTNGGRLSVTP
jgi:large subunit ribosomal protein L2